MKVKDDRTPGAPNAWRVPYLSDLLLKRNAAARLSNESNSWQPTRTVRIRRSLGDSSDLGVGHSTPGKRSDRSLTIQSRERFRKNFAHDRRALELRASAPQEDAERVNWRSDVQRNAMPDNHPFTFSPLHPFTPPEAVPHLWFRERAKLMHLLRAANRVSPWFPRWTQIRSAQKSLTHFSRGETHLCSS